MDAKSFAERGGDSGPAIIAKDSMGSDLWRRVVSSEDGVRMPPEGQRLSDAEQELLKQWIDEGALWLETDEDRAATHDPRLGHWAWQPLREGGPPSTIPDPAAYRNAIDLFLNDKLHELGLQFSRKPIDGR